MMRNACRRERDVLVDFAGTCPCGVAGTKSLGLTSLLRPVQAALSRRGSRDRRRCTLTLKPSAGSILPARWKQGTTGRRSQEM